MAQPDRDYPACLTLEKEKMVVVAGGLTSLYEPTRTVEAYLIEADIWVPLSPLPIVGIPFSMLIYAM